MRTGQKISWLLTLASVAAIICAMMEIGPLGTRGAAPPTLFISLIVGITSFICIFMFRRFDKVWARVKAGKDLLARWTYSEEDWRSFSKGEYERLRKEKAMLLKIVAGISAVAVVVCFFISRQFGVWITAILGGTWVLCWLAARASLRPYRQNERGASREALITADGMLLGAAFHAWRGWGNRLEEVGLDEGPPPQVVIRYSVPGGRGTRNKITACVPVPAGKQDEAIALLQRLERQKK